MLFRGIFKWASHLKMCFVQRVKEIKIKKIQCFIMLRCFYIELGKRLPFLLHTMTHHVTRRISIQVMAMATSELWHLTVFNIIIHTTLLIVTRNIQFLESIKKKNQRCTLKQNPYIYLKGFPVSWISWIEVSLFITLNLYFQILILIFSISCIKCICRRLSCFKKLKNENCESILIAGTKTEKRK